MPTSASVPALDLSVTIDDLAALPRAGQPWHERQMKLAANAAYDESSDTVQLTRFSIESEAMRLAAAGRIEHWTKDRELALSGKADYDLEKLTVLLQPYFGGDLRATGRESQSFSLSGPIGAALRSNADPAAVRDQALRQEQAVQQMVGQAEFGWQTASLLGFDVAGGNLQASLAKGTLQVVPTRLNVSGGTITLAPVVRLSPLPAELHVPAGPLIDHVRATPEMCRLWMMYVAPALAGITKIDGTISVQLAGCQVPLALPKTSEVAGQILVHSLDVEPGPLVQELSVLLGSPSTVRLAKDSKIDFKMVQGRVYHRGLELQFPEMTVRTYGSVGVDQTLAIMAEMNVPTAWIRDSALTRQPEKPDNPNTDCRNPGARKSTATNWPSCKQSSSAMPPEDCYATACNANSIGCLPRRSRSSRATTLVRAINRRVGQYARIVSWVHPATHASLPAPRPLEVLAATAARILIAFPGFRRASRPKMWHNARQSTGQRYCPAILRHIACDDNL